MKNYYLWVFVTVMLLGADTLTSAEIIPVWHKVNGEGTQEDMIHDIEFLRGEDQFIMIAGVNERGAIQIRDTQTGELVSSFPLHTLNQFNQIEITPDSNRCIITTGGSRLLGPTIELRNLSDYSIISKDSLEMEGETKDPQGNPYQYVFHDMIVDPVRPLVYVLVEKTNFSSNKYKDRFYIKVYNYEIMQLIKDITPSDYNGEWPSKDLFIRDDNYLIDVSDDGRYLASLNGDETYLYVWDLETMEIIHKVKLYDSSLEDPRCEVQDIEFSSIDKDLIYFSGYFPKKDNSIYPDGIFKYSLSNDNYKRIDLNNDYAGKKFIIFDNEERILDYAGGDLYFLNQISKIRELYISASLEYPLGEKTIRSKKDGLFIGYSGQFIGSLKYDSQTGIINTSEKQMTFSPNPTTGILNISINNKFPSTFRYDIVSDSGQTILSNNLGFLQPNNNNVNINISSVPMGHYLLRVTSDREAFTFNIIKE